MQRIGRPRGLIAYDTFRNLEAVSHHHDRAPLRLVRPRTILYSALIALVAAIMLWAWLSRTMLEVDVLHDRNPVYVELTDGGVRNGYVVKILNKLHETRSFRLALEGLEGATLSAVGIEGSDPKIDVITDNLRALKVLVTVPKDARGKLNGASTPFRFVVTDTADQGQTHHRANFQGPAP
jgi:polyferredoxin